MLAGCVLLYMVLITQLFLQSPMRVLKMTPFFMCSPLLSFGVTWSSGSVSYSLTPLSAVWQAVPSLLIDVHSDSDEACGVAPFSTFLLGGGFPLL